MRKVWNDWSTYAYIECDGKVVCVRKLRENRKNWWHFPGGKRDGNETLEETLLREIREETGISIEFYQARLLGRTVRRIRKKHKHRPYTHQYVLYFYYVELFEGQFASRDICTPKDEELLLLDRSEIEEKTDFLKSHYHLARTYLPILQAA